MRECKSLEGENPLFQLTPLTWMGLDIQSSAIRMLQLQVEKKMLRVAGFTEIPIASDLPETITETLQKYFAATPMKRMKVAIAVPTYAIITKRIPRYVDIPQYFPVDSMAYDYVEREDQVLVIAAKKALVEQRVMAVERAGLTVNIVDVECYAFLRGAMFKRKDTFFGVLHVTASSSEFFVVRESEIIFHQIFSTVDVSSQYVKCLQQLQQSPPTLFLTGDREPLSTVTRLLHGCIQGSIVNLNPFDGKLSSTMLTSLGLALRGFA